MANKFLTIILFFVFSINCIGQDYKKWMNSSDVKVENIISAAEAYLANNPSKKERKMFERWKYNAIRQQDENGYLRKRSDVERELYRFIEEKQTLETQRNGAANWEELGPTDWNATSGYNPGVGRITSFAKHPIDPNIFIVGSVSGGVWKTIDGGTTWSVLSDDYINMEVYALAIDPSSPSTFYWGSTFGRVYKSTDAGLTWNVVGTTDNYGNVNKIIVNPNNSDIVLASSESSGIFLSTDGGATFYLEIPNWNEPEGFDIEFKPGNSNIVYAAGNKFHKSTDGGDTYTTISGFDYNDQPKMIGTSPADPNRVYVIEASNGEFNALYVSNDSGDSFTKIPHTQNFFGYDGDGLDFGAGQAPRDMAIAVSPNDADEVHIAGINTWRSLNGGTSFELSSYWVYNGIGNYCHADVDDLTFVGSTLVALTDGGIYFANDPRGTIPDPAFYVDKTTGMGIHQFYKIGVSQTSSAVITGGAQDNGNSAYDGTNWKNWLGADGMESFVDKTNSNILYGTQQYGNLFKSTDGGLTSFALTQPNASSGSWVTPFEQDPSNENTIYAGFTEVYKSTDGGNSWTSISQDFGQNLNNLKIAPSDNNIMFASINDNLYKTTTGSGTWTVLSGFSGYINSIAIHPTDPNKVAIATTSADKIYLSLDGGSTWTVKNSGLPNFSALCLTWQNSADNCLYLGMDYGVYYINDVLANWTNYSSQLPNVRINELEINNAEGKIYAATWGRGLWKSDLQSPILPIELGGFDANIKDRTVHLSWFTLSEIDNDYFIVEKSTDGINWEELTEVKSKGDSSSRQDYETIDDNPSNGLNYYRLIDVDLTGNREYSKVIVANLTGVDLLNIYPNPSKGRFMLYLDASKASDIEIMVYNSSGILEYQKNQSIDSGGNVVPVELKNEDGVYLLTVFVDGVKVYYGKRLIVEK